MQKMHTRHHMTTEMGEAMQGHMAGDCEDTLSDRDDLDGLSKDSDSDLDDGWLSEDDGKLGLAKNKISLGHFKAPQREP